MNSNWLKTLTELFEGIRIIQQSKKETLLKFEQFCEFVAEPAFESLVEALGEYKVKAKIKKKKEKCIILQINFEQSRVEQFEYILELPQNSVEFKLSLTTRGRRTKKGRKEEESQPFLIQAGEEDLLKISKEDIIIDVINHYRDHVYDSLTSNK
ncbi:MAG: hypothetical protein ACOC57_03380 [Acidobacteriota bacterium]